MKTRLQYIITNEGLTNIRFAELLGVNPASISHILAERNKPSFDFIVKIAEKLPQYNLRWLLTGKGEPIESAVDIEESTMATSIAPTPSLTTTVLPENTSLEEVSSLPQDVDYTSEQNSNDVTKSEISPVTMKNAPTSKLIVCFPDGTFEEFSRR